MTAAPLRPRLTAALASALADSPTGERLAEVAVGVIVGEIEGRLERHYAEADRTFHHYSPNVAREIADELEDLRDALRSEP